MIDHNHPAVEAATFAQWNSQRESHWCPYDDVSDVVKDRWRRGTTNALNAALSHLTADDLRDTPAGRALMAEGKSAGWDDALNELRKGQGMHRALAGTLATRKPNYEEADA